MLAATILHSLSAVCVLLIVIGFGVFLARKGWFDAPSHRGIVSKDSLNISPAVFSFRTNDRSVLFWVIRSWSWHGNHLT